MSPLRHVSFLVIACLAAGILAGCTPPPPLARLPRLILDKSVGDDFAALAQSTWQQFLEVFQTHTNCFGDVHLRAATDLPSRAAYNPQTATITVRVPGSAAMLQSALVHEWAHHIEFQCPAQKEMRAAFIAAQGLPPGTLWRPDNTPANTPESEWASIPSEQCAEAAIELVLGERPIPTTARVSPGAVGVLREWAKP